MGGLELFLIPVIAYGIWRFALFLQGRPYQPEGKWQSRLTAAYEYQKTLPRMSGREIARRLGMTLVIAVVELAIVLLIVRARR